VEPILQGRWWLSREINGSEYAPSILGNARRIEWEGDFPSDLRAIVEPVFAPLEAVIPTWLQTVYLRYVADLDSTLTIELSIRNRWGLIRIGSMWFLLTEVERENSLIHELCHALLEPFNWNTRRALEAYGPEEDSPGRKLLDQSISDGMEQAVEDMARAMQKLLHGRMTATPTG
jgi:hypothetical protein